MGVYIDVGALATGGVRGRKRARKREGRLADLTLSSAGALRMLQLQM